MQTEEEERQRKEKQKDGRRQEVVERQLRRPRLGLDNRTEKRDQLGAGFAQISPKRRTGYSSGIDVTAAAKSGGKF